jgi:hypothetical protein
MKIGDLVRTKQKQRAYGYKRPICLIIGTKKRMDGLVVEMIDSEHGILRWLKEELEVISESR